MAWLRCTVILMIIVRERADPSQRPVLAWIQKHHTRATEWDMDLSKVTNVSGGLEYEHRIISS